MVGGRWVSGGWLLMVALQLRLTHTHHDNDHDQLNYYINYSRAILDPSTLTRARLCAAYCDTARRHATRQHVSAAVATQPHTGPQPDYLPNTYRKLDPKVVTKNMMPLFVYLKLDALI